MLDLFKLAERQIQQIFIVDIKIQFVVILKLLAIIKPEIYFFNLFHSLCFNDSFVLISLNYLFIWNIPRFKLVFQKFCGSIYVLLLRICLLKLLEISLKLVLLCIYRCSHFVRLSCLPYLPGDNLIEHTIVDWTWPPFFEDQ